MAGVTHIRVCEEDDDRPIEIPVESDETVLLTTLNGVFPKATGLKYLVEESGCYRGVRLTDGRLYPPPEGWIHNYTCAFPKSDKKRKVEEEQEFQSTKSKKLDGKKCTDLIVLNLAWKTDENCLRDYFSRYGELVMVQVKRHQGTQNSKGYGFIRFNEYEAQGMCLSERHHIDGRWCDVRVPMSKAEGDKQEVVEVFVPKQPRSFAFVTFEDPEVAASLLGKEQKIDGRTVTIGTAVPKLPPQTPHHAPVQLPMTPWGWSGPPSMPSWSYPPQDCGMRGYNQGIRGPVQMTGMNMMNQPNPTTSQFPQHFNRHYPVSNNRINM